MRHFVPGLSLEEVGHLLLTGSIGLIARNPYVSLGVGFYHWIYHQDEPASPSSPPRVYLPLAMRPGMSPGGGGPGHSLTSTNPPPSVEATGASLAQLGKPGVPASSSKRGSRPRRKCKPGYRWNGHRCVRKD